MTVQEISGVRHYTWKKGDILPTPASHKVSVGSTGFEEDTGLEYKFGVDGWAVEASSLAGGDVSPGNSSAALLGAGATFTGEIIDISDVAMVTINIFSDVASAIDGLVFEQSSDGINFDHDDKYSILANDGSVFTPNKAAQFARVKYTNGATPQAAFRLQTILNYVYGKPSSHRVDEDILGQDDAELNISVIKVPTNDETTLKNVDVQNPFPVDGDSVYAKDLDLTNSSIGTFTGILESLFNDYNTEISDITATNPKTFTVRLRRPMTTAQLGIGSLTGNFSNVKIELKDLAGTVRGGIDDSGNNTKFTSAVYPFAPVTFIEIVIEFHTADPVKISGLFVPKDVSVVARIQGQKPDGTITNFEATAAGNFKISLEEYDEAFNTNPLPVVQTDPTGRKAELDNKFKVPISIDVAHHELHEGDSFVAFTDTTLAAAANLNFAFKTPDTTKEMHMVVMARGSAESNIQILEGVTITPSSGAQHAAFNRERNSANETDLEEATTGAFVAGNISLDATIAGGLEIYNEHFGAGQNRGGESRGTDEFVLKANTEYAIIFNSEAANNDSELILDWYEHTPE